MSLKSTVKTIVPSRIWNMLRLAKMRRSVIKFPQQIVEHSYSGFKLKVNIEDPLANGWYNHDWPDLPEVSFLKKNKLKPGARVFDLGAHQGIVALVLAKTVSPQGSVIAIEANQHNHRVAVKNKNLNQQNNLEIIWSAVSDQPGEIVFNQGLNGAVDDGSGAWGRVTVPATTIDELTQKYGKPDVVFVDVEGFECQVLDGGKNTLNHRPDFFIEVHVGEKLENFGGSVETIIQTLNEFNYDLFMMGEKSSEVVPFDINSDILANRFFLFAIQPQN